MLPLIIRRSAVPRLGCFVAFLASILPQTMSFAERGDLLDQVINETAGLAQERGEELDTAIRVFICRDKLKSPEDWKSRFRNRESIQNIEAILSYLDKNTKTRTPKVDTVHVEYVSYILMNVVPTNDSRIRPPDVSVSVESLKGPLDELLNPERHASAERGAAITSGSTAPLLTSCIKSTHCTVATSEWAKEDAKEIASAIMERVPTEATIVVLWSADAPDDPKRLVNLTTCRLIATSRGWTLTK